MIKKVSIKNHPLFNNEKTLFFDNFDDEELTELTINQKIDEFLSRWLRVMHPFSKYEKYFKNSDREKDRILRDVKIYYKKYCLEEDWTEKKYVMVIDNIMKGSFPITKNTIEFSGKLFDDERLEVQLTEKRLRGRKRI